MKLIITLAFLLFSSFLQAEISVSVSRSPVVVDESFQLVFESTERIEDEPDFSALSKSFTILSTGQRSNRQIVNGRVARFRQWILTLVANHPGTLPIPSIRIGDEFSKPNSLNVVASAPLKDGKGNGDIFVEVEVDTKTPYVQSQVIYTVKLYLAVQASNASLSEPEISGGQAVINKLGEDKRFETQLKGRAYSVIQRQYIIFPQSSGILKIEPLVFQGHMGGGGFFNFDPFGPQSKSIIKRSDSIQLEVKPIPNSFIGDTWLPARQLTIQEQWSVNPEKLQQGEATTRTLRLIARGLAASHLPAIDNQLPEKLKQYPDQPELEEKNNENGFMGVRREKMAIIPTEAGDYILPAIKVPWWNTEEDKMEVAELPERTIHVAISTQAPINNIQQELIENETTLIEEGLDKNNAEFNQSSEGQFFWKILSFILLLLWMATLFLFLKKSRKPANSDNLLTKEVSSQQNIKNLKRACAANDPVMAKQALLDWAKSFWSDKKITSIDAVKEFCGENLQTKIDELNMCLYGKEGIEWDGISFLRSFESQSFERKTSVKEAGKLEALYK